MISKLDKQTFMSVFKSHGVLHSYGLVPHLSKKLSYVLISSACSCMYLYMKVIQKILSLTQKDEP